MTAPPALSQLIESLCAEQRRRWQSGERVLADTLIDKHPTIASHPDQVVELVYNEVLLREEHGETPQLEEYLLRFPQLSEELRRLFEVHGALGSEVLLQNYHSILSTRRLQRESASATLIKTLVVPGYEILGELGRGGMGVVYQARHLALNRLVALKMIRTGVHADAEELARFHTEAEAAARVQHPHLVQIFDVGEAEGRPYLALEYVEGGNLAQKIAGTPQPPQQAARFLEILARAMHAAHQRNLIHRDLKPANVLLTTDGTPKIADFGLAKRIAGEPGASATGGGDTKTGAILGTPSYMAPEQATGKSKEIGPAADIYALGVILYEMLTGRPPFLGESPLDTLHQVKTLEPVPPRRLQPKVPRDLETICLKCLQKEPTRRYDDAAALAEDLRRFQVGEPIRARPVGNVERFWRWCRRKPMVAGLAAGLLLALGVGVTGIIWQWQRADAHAHKEAEQRLLAEEYLEAAIQAVDEYLDQVSEDPRLLGHDLEGLRKRLLQSAMPFYQKFARQRPDDPKLQAAWAGAQLRLAYLTWQLDSRTKAIELYESALDIFTRLTKEHPEVADYQANLARCYSELGNVHVVAHAVPQAEAAFTESLKIRQSLAKAHPDQLKYQADLATSHMSLGNLYADHGRTKEAQEPLETGLKLHLQVTKVEPKNARFQHRLATNYLNLGILYRQIGLPNQEKEHLLEAAKIHDDLAAKSPTITTYQYSRAETYKHLGLYYMRAGVRQLADAKAAHLTSEKIHKKLTEDHSRIVRYHLALAETWDNLGNFYKIAKEPAEAEKYLLQALDKFNELNKDHPNDSLYQSRVASANHNLGVFYLEIGKLDKAGAPLQKARELREELLRDHPLVTEYANNLGNSYVSLGDLAVRQPKMEGALEWYGKAVSTLEIVYQKDERNPRARELLYAAHRQRALLLAKQNKPEEALVEWDRAIERGPERKTDEAKVARLIVLAQLNDHVQVAAGVSALTTDPEAKGDILYRVAAFCSLLSTTVLKDPRIKKDEGARLAEQYAARAVELLARAQATGFFRLPGNNTKLEKDPNLAPLRSREDFKKLLMPAAGGVNPPMAGLPGR